MKNINLVKISFILLLINSCSNKQVDNKIKNNNKIFNNYRTEILNENIDKDNIMFLKTIYYNFNSFELTREARQNLDLLSRYLSQDNNKNKTITLYGYCDDIGTNDYNYNLGLNRAFSAKQYLIIKGINKDRINIISLGKRDNERKVIIRINK